MKKSFAIKFILIVFLVTTLNQLVYSKSYWSGEVRTKESYSYGRIETRMRSASASGVTSTIFTYNILSSTYNEIDIEIMGKDNNEVQYTTFTPDEKGVNFRQALNFNPHAAFHVHAIEWTPDYVAWYVDGYEVHRDNSDRIRTLGLSQAIMMNFWMPNSVEWAGKFDDRSIPLYAMYDWVKFYDYTPGINNNFTLRWTDNFSTFDNNRWVKSNSTFGSNLCDFKAQNVLTKDGYLILCMTKEGQTASYNSSINDVDVDAPYAMSGWIYKDHLKIQFSEEVEKVSAEDISNYITLGLTLSNFSISSSNRIVSFDVGGASPAGNFPVAIRNIKDLAATPNQAKLKVLSVKSTHLCPLVSNLGDTSLSNSSWLREQKWDETKEYGSIGGSIKITNYISVSNEYANLYKNANEGITFYRQRLKSGVYKIKLLFAEPTIKTIGGRVFDVYVNGKLLVENLDIYKEVGTGSPLEKVFTGVQVEDNLLELYFFAKAGSSIIHGIIIDEETGTSVIKEELIPNQIELNLFPNPFNPTTSVQFTLPKRTDVNVRIYDGLGKLCRELASKKYEAGVHTLKFDASGLSSGIYFVQLSTVDNMLTKKIAYLK